MSRALPVPPSTHSYAHSPPPPQDPVVLPDSRVCLDRATIERHLLSSATDPFSRAPLTKDQLLPAPELRARIREWQAGLRRAPGGSGVAAVARPEEEEQQQEEGVTTRESE